MTTEAMERFKEYLERQDNLVMIKRIDVVDHERFFEIETGSLATWPEESFSLFIPNDGPEIK